MKKKIFLVIAAIMCSSALFAFDLDFKGGVMHPTSPNKFGLDTAVAANFILNQNFLFGVETGFGWVNWSGIDQANDNPAVIRPDLYPSHAANLYYLPILATFTAQANMAEVIPYLSFGLGYAWDWYREKDNNDSFNSYTWQILGGIKWKFKTRVLLITEMGFRSAQTESNHKIMDMTGWIGRVGVCVPFNFSSSANGTPENK